jgi:signal transduction histidine kinase/HAMP domain-containing protein
VTPLAQRSVAAQFRLLGIALLILFPLLAAATLGNLYIQARNVRALTLTLGPALENNNSVLLTMTEADGAYREQLQGATPAVPYTAKRPVVRAELAGIAHAIAQGWISDSLQRRYAAQLALERSAVDAWFTSADRTVAATSTTGAEHTALQADTDAAFASFRTANRALDATLRSERDAARTGSRASIGVVAVVITVTALVAMALILLALRHIRVSLTQPLQRLREVVERQRSGDRDARADTEHGAAEIRELAQDFNGLIRANQVLQEQQAQVLLSHQLALDVARQVHSASDVETAMHVVSAMLGEGLAADRVLLYTHDGSGGIGARMQWHRYDLPDLPPLPPSLAQRVHTVNEELRRDATFFAVADFLAPEVQADPRAEGFYRSTGARSLLMVPVGVGEQGLGVLSVLMVDGPRRWRRHEIQSAQQCAGYVAQAMMAISLAQMADEQVQRLTELDRQKTDFMATVSHELRTPLTSINGYLELLEDGDYGQLTREQRGALSIIERNASRLRGLIEDLLVLNKIEATGLHLSMGEVQVASLVSEVVEILRPAAENGGVELGSDPVDGALVVLVDRGQFERTLINLGANAVKFTPRGGSARISAERDGDRVVVLVSDTGIGIPAADQERLFGRFFRASNATAKAIPGTGLGLAIAKAIVEGHGGTLEVESVEGEGTTMRVCLPLVQHAERGEVPGGDGSTAPDPGNAPSATSV